MHFFFFLSGVTHLFSGGIAPTVDAQLPAQGQCSIEADRHFGPAVEWCREQFDFTLLFQETILAILPCAVFILLALTRNALLLRRPVVVRSGWLYTAKLVVAATSSALQVALLVLAHLHHGTQTAASVPSTSVALVASLLAGILSALEHRRTSRPSSLLLGFLFLTILFEVVRVRTYWLMSQKIIASLVTAECVVRVSFFALETLSKTACLVEPGNEKSTEELAGPIAISFFTWLNPTFRTGYKRALAPDEVGPIDGLLYSGAVSNMFKPMIHREPGATSVLSFIRLTFTCVGWHLLSPVIPRLALTAFTYSQVFLVDKVIDYLSSDAPKSSGYGLIGACVFVYTGIAVATAAYWRQVYRLMAVLRGGLIMAVFEKMLRLAEDGETESKATTMMVSDVQHILGGVKYMHDIWVSLVETGLATYLLYRQIGISCMTIIGLALLAGIFSLWTSKATSVQSQFWLGCTQIRIGATKRLFDSLKSVKMMGHEDKAGAIVEKLRSAEIQSSRAFRLLMIVSVFLSYTMLTIAPVVIFGTYIGIAGTAHVELNTAKLFSSMVIVSLIGSPLIHVLQALPGVGSAYGCYKRIHDFLQTPEPSYINRGEDSTLDLTGKKSPEADKDAPISIQDASLGWTSDTPILRHLNFKVPKGYQIAIMGGTGSGKTLLMKTLAGEVAPICGSVAVPRRRLAYCAQVPWLENLSAEETWTKHMMNRSDMAWAREIASCCALDDILALPDYKTGTIGTAGVRLSGGQKHRLALARAIASGKDVVLLDDVFNALDRKTRTSISSKLLGPGGLFRQLGITAIYTTHDNFIASLANEIYEINEQGVIQRIVAHAPENGIDLVGETDKGPHEHSDCTEIGDSNLEEEEQDVRPTADRPSVPEQPKPQIPRDTAVYMRYFQAMGWVNVALFLVLGIIFAFTLKFPDIWLQWWSSAAAKGGGRGNGYWLGIFGVLEMLPLILLCVWVLHLLMVALPVSARALHSALLQVTLQAPFAYMSRVDTGSLLTRFNQDLMFVDGYLPTSLFNVVDGLFTAAFQMILIAIVAHEALAVLPVLATTLYLIQRVYLRTSKQLRLMELEWQSHLHTKFGETASGLATIRANGWEETMRREFCDKLDRSQEPVYLLNMAQLWLQLVLGLTMAGLAVTIAGISVALKETVVAGAVGVAFLNMTSLGETLTNFVVAWTSLETSLGAIARIISFERDTPRETDEEPEEAWATTAIDQAWPKNGHVRFENVFATYDTTGGQPVWNLRGLNLEILPGQRVAVCGRTGSGKSTLLLTLLGMLEMPSGRVVIDGIDTSAVQMRRLRRRFRTISQDSFSHGGTFRQDLDPEGRHSDEAVREALEAVGVWDKVLSSGGLEGKRSDAGLSNGEAQLVALCGLVLSESHQSGGIVILDEATSSLSHESAMRVEELLAEKLRGKTVISVLHKIESAAKYDKIAVLEGGVLVAFGDAEDVVAECDLFAPLRKT